MVDAIETTERAYVTSRTDRCLVCRRQYPAGARPWVHHLMVADRAGPEDRSPSSARLQPATLPSRSPSPTGTSSECWRANVNQTSEQLGRLYREIEARTHELAEALTYQTATGEVLKAISRSTLHLQPVLDTLVETATQLCRADKGFLFRLEDGLYRLRASFGFDQEFKQFIERPSDPARCIRNRGRAHRHGTTRAAL